MSGKKCQSHEKNQIEMCPLLAARIRRQKRLAKETPEQTAARRAKSAEISRRRRAKLAATETPEEAKARRSRELEYAVRSRKELLARETPEEKNARFLRRAANLKRYRENKLDKLKAEYKELYLEKIAELKIIKKAKLLASETPEQTTARLLRQSQKSARLRKERYANETPEQRNARLLREQEYNKNYRLKRKQMLQAMQNDFELKRTAQEATNTILSKFPNERTDDDINGSCTCSSFEASEGSYNLSTTDGGSSNTMFDEIRSDKSMIIKNEPWSWYQSETVQSNFVTGIKSRTDNMVSGTGIGRDEHLEYGVYVADIFHKSNRNRFEVNVAMKLIDDVMFNLSIGRYSLKCVPETNLVDQKEKAPSLAMPYTTQTIVQNIIVKEELDL